MLHVSWELIPTRFSGTTASFGIRKYKGTKLYMLPPSLFHNDPMDTMDKRYLDASFAPMVSPLKRPLSIALYNDTYVAPNSKKISNHLLMHQVVK